ncbi:MAG: Hsp20/alpha crystallin family protein [bacterium]
MLKKRSFFERLTGGIRLEDEVQPKPNTQPTKSPAMEMPAMKKSVTITPKEAENFSKPIEIKEPEVEEGQLTVDVYQTTTEIIVQTMVAGVRPEDLQINITRDQVTIRGKREENKTITDEQFFIKELYWGAFSRTVLLPQEVEPDMAEAIEKHGLLIIKIPKIDKSKQTTLKVKSI